MLAADHGSQYEEERMGLKPQSVFVMLIVMLVAVAPVPAFQDAAKPQDEVKAREERTRQALAVMDEMIRDAQSLRLPENRFHIFVQTASALWPMDEKRARMLL